MSKKRKLTATEKAEKKRRRAEYQTIFINGKQKRVKRPMLIDGIDEDEFIRRNADPIWLHQNSMWEYMEPLPEDAERMETGSLGQPRGRDSKRGDESRARDEADDDIPF